MAGLKEIAEASGVSIRTVSRVLTTGGYVGQATRQKVLAAAARLGYRPNRFARSLRRGKSHEIAVVAWSTDELHMAKIVAFERVLRGRDYSVSMLFGNAPVGEEGVDDLVDELLSRRLAAVAAFTGGRIDMSSWADRLSSAGTPYVVFDAPPSVQVDSVRIDRPRGVYEAVLHLAGRGRQRIAYLGHRDDVSRLSGYHRALAELGRQPAYIELPEPGRRLDEARAAAQAWAAMSPRPDAVQAFSDEVAMAFLAGLHELGARVGDDVAVVGFDDRRAASLCWPRLTTVAQPNAEVGAAAAEVLLAKIDGQAAPPEGWSRTIATRLVVRDSG